jgi:hypothetical protein
MIDKTNLAFILQDIKIKYNYLERDIKEDKKHHATIMIRELKYLLEEAEKEIK